MHLCDDVIEIVLHQFLQISSNSDLLAAMLACKWFQKVLTSNPLLSERRIKVLENAPFNVDVHLLFEIDGDNFMGDDEIYVCALFPKWALERKWREISGKCDPDGWRTVARRHRYQHSIAGADIQILIIYAPQQRYFRGRSVAASFPWDWKGSAESFFTRCKEGCPLPTWGTTADYLTEHFTKWYEEGRMMPPFSRKKYSRLIREYW